MDRIQLVKSIIHGMFLYCFKIDSCPPREMLQSHQEGKKEKTMGRESRKMVQLNLICKD